MFQIPNRSTAGAVENQSAVELEINIYVIMIKYRCAIICNISQLVVDS